MKSVEEVMTRTVVVVTRTTPFKEIVRTMHEHRVSAVPVVDDAAVPIGIVSERDLLLKEELPEATGSFLHPRRFRRDMAKAEGLRAADLMTTPVVTIGPAATIAAAARIMHRRGIKRLPVVDASGRIVGIVSRVDLLQVFLRSDHDIRIDVENELRTSPEWIDFERVTVTVKDGVVRVQGMVEQRSQVATVVGLAERVDGVVGVNDRLSYEVDDLRVPAEFLTPWGVDGRA
jgi:CBS-domain-containing membrane protein